MSNNHSTQQSVYDALAGKITYYENPKKLQGFVRDTFTWKDTWGSVGVYGLYIGSKQVSNFTKTGFDKSSDMTYAAQRGEVGLTGKYIGSEKFYFDSFLVGKLYFLDTVYNVKAGVYSSSKETRFNAFDAEFDMRMHRIPNTVNDLTFGVNTVLTTMSGTAFEKRKYALETALFVQDVISLFDGKLTLVPDARFTVAPSIQGSGVISMGTPKLSIKYNPVETTALRFSYGMGYKIPSLKEKYWIFRHNYAP